MVFHVLEKKEKKKKRKGRERGVRKTKVTIIILPVHVDCMWVKFSLGFTSTKPDTWV